MFQDCRTLEFSLQVSTCSPTLSETKWRNDNGGGELGQRLRFRFAMEIVSAGLAGEFAQQDKFCTGRVGLTFLL